MPPDPSVHRSGISRRTLLRGGGAVAFAGVSLAALKLPLFEVGGRVKGPAGGVSGTSGVPRSRRGCDSRGGDDGPATDGSR